MEFSQSRTFKNLQDAFEGELKTSTLYEIYGLRARQEGFIQISDVYNIVSGFEREHAKVWYRLIHENNLPSTFQNLTESALIEDKRSNVTYREYGNIAREEGFTAIGALFDGVANIELNQNVIFQNFASNMQANEVFCKTEEVLWICINCGNIMGRTCAPEICPICSFPQGYYQVYDSNATSI